MSEGSYDYEKGHRYALQEILRPQIRVDLPTRDNSVRWLLAHAMQIMHYISDHGDTGEKWAELRETILAAQVAERLREDGDE